MKTSDLVDAVCAAQGIVGQYIRSEHHTLPNRVAVLAPAAPMGSSSHAAVGLPAFVADTKGFGLELRRQDGMEALLAYFLRWKNPDRVRIVYSGDLNQCWARLLICKELSHVLLGKSENFSNTDKSVTSLLTALINGESDDGRADIVVERVAFHSAIEMLLPYQFQKEAAELKEHGCTEYQLAKHFLVPESVIEFRYSEPVVALFEEAYAQLGLE